MMDSVGCWDVFSIFVLYIFPLLEEKAHMQQLQARLVDFCSITTFHTGPRDVPSTARNWEIDEETANLSGEDDFNCHQKTTWTVEPKISAGSEQVQNKQNVKNKYHTTYIHDESLIHHDSSKITLISKLDANRWR